MGTCCRRRRRRRSMRPLAALRDRFTHVPAAVLRRSESGAARAAVINDVRAVFPDMPRDAGPEHLIRHARRLVLAAARDEFARGAVAAGGTSEGRAAGSTASPSQPARAGGAEEHHTE